jgi:hypothetical protein
MTEYVISDTQALLAVDTVKGGKRYFRESEFFGKNLTAQDVISEVGDTAIRIYRLDVDPMGLIEDITERVAREYLNIADNDEFGVQPSALPTYVRQSTAWAVWQDDERDMSPVGVNAAHRLALSHATGTLDHKSQGLVRGAVMS